MRFCMSRSERMNRRRKFEITWLIPMSLVVSLLLALSALADQRTVIMQPRQVAQPFVQSERYSSVHSSVYDYDELRSPLPEKFSVYKKRLSGVKSLHSGYVTTSPGIFVEQGPKNSDEFVTKYITRPRRGGESGSNFVTLGGLLMVRREGYYEHEVKILSVDGSLFPVKVRNRIEVKTKHRRTLWELNKTIETASRYLISKHEFTILRGLENSLCPKRSYRIREVIHNLGFEEGKEKDFSKSVNHHIYCPYYNLSLRKDSITYIDDRVYKRFTEVVEILDN